MGKADANGGGVGVLLSATELWGRRACSSRTPLTSFRVNTFPLCLIIMLLPLCGSSFFLDGSVKHALMG